jgi:hypothetical protein
MGMSALQYYTTAVSPADPAPIKGDNGHDAGAPSMNRGHK